MCLFAYANIGEKQRILSAGGRVFAVEYEDGQDGPQRVWLGHMDVPGLAMSRSLGDKVSKLLNSTTLSITHSITHSMTLGTNHSITYSNT
jgi:hypothetical protein